MDCNYINHNILNSNTINYLSNTVIINVSINNICGGSEAHI